MRVYFTFGKSLVEEHCAPLCGCQYLYIVGIRDGCRLRARRLIKYCLRIVLPSGITNGIIVKDGIFTDLNLYCIKGALALVVLVSFSGYAC